MADKFQNITELYESTAKAATATPSSWRAFLTFACRNYRLPFDEQLLIYAQRPDAPPFWNWIGGTSGSDGGSTEALKASLCLTGSIQTGFATTLTWPILTKPGCPGPCPCGRCVQSMSKM